MSTRITIQPVTRIEGHAKVTLHVDEDGAINGAQFHVIEFRGFEKIALGRPFTEMPGLMARICGICPISHIIASSKAGDMLLGVRTPRAAVLQRRLLTDAQILQSHALSFFHLSSPDLLLGFDAPPSKRNLFGVAETDVEFARAGIRLRQLGQRIIEGVTGKRVHPNWGIPGGVLGAVPGELRDEVLARLPESYAAMDDALGRAKRWADQYAPEIEGMGNFPSLHAGLVGADGAPDYYDGKLRLVDGDGNVVAPGLDPRRYFEYLEERAEPWSYMKFPFYKPLGYPNGMYRVGPLSRLNVATCMGTERADREFVELRQRGGGAVNASFHYHLARLVEMVGALERMERLFADPELLSADVRSRAMLNEEEGIGSCEAPRGVLFHHYKVDGNGLVTSANLLIATAQNNLAINRTVEQAARRFVKPDALQEGMLNRVEAAIRCYDPCLSCSTHALGQMPLVLELVGPDGTVRDRLQRE
ncbi:MAG: Ni/Fe hydrogenase subunit alpha [Bryobacterales bacterium]|nr:Ni/Fe hydrogenase subunit alpha [Bryobacterales bacterium]